MSAVEEIKQRVDIVDLISQYVALKRAGRGFVARCPFHQEKTPSFHVDPQRQSWHCFGACATGGDVISFVEKKENVEFREALRLLAERAGVELDGGRRDRQEDARRARLYDVNEAAAAFFSAALQSEGAARAREYMEQRRIAAAAVDAFQLGFAPSGWDAATVHLRGRGFEAADVVAAGVAIEGERGVYDRFRGRLMFPIRDDRGRIAGFGGRVLPGDDAPGAQPQPKYLNTPQTPIFDKGAMLYALDRARDAIRQADRAVIVEGYMDAIAAHEHGHANVIASMGTALTERQVALLKRYTKNLVLALDADAAGSEATLRGVRVVADAVDHEQVPVTNWRGIVRFQETLAADIRVLTLPEGSDPDDVIRADPGAWAKLVESAVPVLDYLFDATLARHGSGARERSIVTSELAPYVAAISDRVVQSHYLQRLARIAQVDERTLRQELRAPVRKADAPDTTGAPATSRTPVAVRDRREEFCLALLFRYPELRSEGAAIDAGLFGQSENRALFEAWVRGAERGGPFEDSLSPDLRPHYERILTTNLPAYDDEALTKALFDATARIEEQRLRLAKRASTAVLADMSPATSADDAERALTAWKRGGDTDNPADDEADPAAAFVEDMEAGLKVHERAIEQRRAATNVTGEVVHER